MNQNIFNYDCPSFYLKSVWLEKRALNKAFSLRSWAKKLGMTHHGNFYQMIEGQRRIPKKYLKPLCESLSLNDREREYFEVLLDFKNAKSLEEKAYFQKKLTSISPEKKLNFKEIENFNFLKNPLCGAIIELTDIKGFKDNPLWIQNRLSFKAGLKEIDDTIQLLLRLKLLVIEGDTLKRSQQHTYSKQDEIDQGLREYHKNILDLGKDQIEKQHILEREYNASAFAIKKENLPSIKQDIRLFTQDMISKYEACPSEGDEIYQIATQFFALTNKKETLQ